MHFNTANWCLQKVREEELRLRDLESAFKNRHASKKALAHITAAQASLTLVREQIFQDGYETDKQVKHE